MAQEVNWDNMSDDGGDFEGSNDRRPKVDWLKVPDNGRSRVRIVSPPVEYRKYWDPVFAYSPMKSPKELNGDPLPDAGYKPSRNYGVWVIDRTDGTLKVYNCSKKILMMFKEWDSIRNIRPWDADKGVDWVISKKKSDGKWQYNVTPVDESPLTADEKSRVADTLKEKPLMEVFRPHTPDELQEMLDSYKANPKGPTPGTSNWYKERRAAAGGGSSSQASAGRVNFDDDSNAADIADDSTSSAFDDDSSDDNGVDGLFGNEDDDEQTESKSSSLF